MPDAQVTPEGMARQAVGRLKALGDPVRAAGVQWYFKETVKSFGVRTPDIRRLAAELYRTVKDTWCVADAVALCDLLYPERELETKGLATLILVRFKKEFSKAMLDRIKGWLAGNYLDSWAAVDGLCPNAVGTLIEKYPGAIADIKTWSSHPNRWVKRASAVSFIKLARTPAYLPAIYEISEALFPVDDDLVQKANGWLLREAGKADAARLEKFLLRHGPAIPRTTLRYAIERFAPSKRRMLLARTRSR